MSDDKSSFELIKWKHEQERAVAERAHDAETEFGSKANEAAIAASNHAIRALILINGGAAAAMLAFIGHIAGVNGGQFAKKLPELTAPLAWFVWGVALGAFCAGMAYCTNYCIGAASTMKTRDYEHPFIRPTTSSKWWIRGAMLCQGFALLAAAGSLVMFLWGMGEVRGVVGTLR